MRSADTVEKVNWSLCLSASLVESVSLSTFYRPGSLSLNFFGGPRETIRFLHKEDNVIVVLLGGTTWKGRISAPAGPHEILGKLLRKQGVSMLLVCS